MNKNEFEPLGQKLFFIKQHWNSYISIPWWFPAWCWSHNVKKRKTSSIHMLTSRAHKTQRLIIEGIRNSNIRSVFFYSDICLLWSTLIIIAMAGFVVVGNFDNVFIASLVSFTGELHWLDQETTNLFSWSNHAAVSSSNIGLLWVIFKIWILTLFNPAKNSNLVRIIFHIAWTVTKYFHNWFDNSFSIFYLLKVANFSNFVFLHLKKKVNRVIIAILLRSLVLFLSSL